MTIDEKCCCNCIHCARWKTSKGIECHCDLDDKYLGYLTVMDIYNDCCKWEKETKWELQEKHDKERYNKAIDDMIAIINSMKETAQAMMWDREEWACDRFIKQAEKLKAGVKNDD